MDLVKMYLLLKNGGISIAMLVHQRVTPEWRYWKRFSPNNSMHHLTSLEKCLTKPVKVNTKVAIARGHSKIRFLGSTPKNTCGKQLFHGIVPFNMLLHKKCGKLRFRLGIWYVAWWDCFSYFSQDSSTSKYDPTAVGVSMFRNLFQHDCPETNTLPLKGCAIPLPQKKHLNGMERSVSLLIPNFFPKQCCQFANVQWICKCPALTAWPYQTPSFESAANP